MEPNGEPLIEVSGLTKTYGSTRAVDGIDLTVHAGEVFGLLGPNGAGKTTTILMLLGLSEPDSGTVRVCGLDPTRDPLAVKRQVGYLPDAVGFYDDLTGRQNLRYTARLNELDPDEAEDRIEHLLEVVGLTDAADRPVGGYSRGMRQRLGVADTLIKDPKVVILDEPTVGIDPEGVVQMQRLITDLAHRDGRAVLLTSHLLHQVQQSCDRMAIFVGGRIVAEGTATELAAGLADGRSLVEVATNGDSSALPGVLAAAFGDAVTAENVGAARWRIALPTDATGAVLRALLDAGIEPVELRDLGSDLDEIYRRYFGRNEDLPEEVIA